MRTFSEYLEARERNRQVVAQASPNLLSAFEVSIQSFDRLGLQLTTGYDRSGKSHVSLAPFFLILQRQAIAAFDALSTNQAYLAWTVVRPGIESALIVGKWVDDKENADIWERRRIDKKRYRQTYEGRALRSAALQRSDEIQSALSRINDEFLHPNPDYYRRHLEFNELEDGDIEMILNFFDDPIDVAIGNLGILHLVVVVQDSLARLFASLFVDTELVDVGLASLETQAKEWASSVAEESPLAKLHLRELGLWPTSVVGG